MWAAYAALGRHEGSRTAPAEARRREEPLRQARQALGPDRARAAEERGAAMSLATAAEYALMLTDPGPPQPPRRRARASSAPGNGNWSPWSPRAAPTPRSPPQLYISIRTVRSHLDRIRDKTGCRRRADLTRLALSRRPGLARPGPAACRRASVACG